MDGDGTMDRRSEPRQVSQLAELLACERELAESLAEAEAEARRLVEEARAEAAAAAADLEASLEDEAERERQRIREEAQTRVRATVSAARDQAARFETVGEARVAELAESAFRRLLSAEPSS